MTKYDKGPSSLLTRCWAFDGVPHFVTNMHANHFKEVPEAEDFWNKFSSSAHLHPANLYRYRLIEKMISNFNFPSDSVMDLGCGNGALLTYLRNCHLGKRLIGVDGALSIIRTNREKLDFAEFYQADLQKIDIFPLQEAVDLVICSEVIEHLPDYQPVFQIAYHQLKPGGFFILTTQQGKRRRHDVQLLGHLRHYDMNILSQEVASFGFHIRYQQQAGWPMLNCQKVVASLLMKQVAKELASSRAPTLFFKMACKLVELGLTISSKHKGPQLMIVGQKAKF